MSATGFAATTFFVSGTEVGLFAGNGPRPASHTEPVAKEKVPADGMVVFEGQQVGEQVWLAGRDAAGQWRTVQTMVKAKRPEHPRGRLAATRPEEGDTSPVVGARGTLNAKPRAKREQLIRNSVEDPRPILDATSHEIPAEQRARIEANADGIAPSVRNSDTGVPADGDPAEDAAAAKRSAAAKKAARTRKRKEAAAKKPPAAKRRPAKKAAAKKAAAKPAAGR